MLDRDAAIARLRARSSTSSTEWYRGSACILWTGYVDGDGYPNKLQVGGVVTSAHRMAYWVAFGPIPAGLQVDHRCHDPDICRDTSACPHRRCINPLHLEAVTPRENTLRSGGLAATNARSSSCVRGHPFDKVHATGRRRCSTCEQDLGREEYGARTPEQRARRGERRRELDAAEPRQERKNRSSRLAKRGLRPTECLNGHAYEEGSFRIGQAGRRVCLVCRRERNQDARRSGS